MSEMVRKTEAVLQAASSMLSDPELREAFKQNLRWQIAQGKMDVNKAYEKLVKDGVIKEFRHEQNN